MSEDPTYSAESFCVTFWSFGTIDGKVDGGSRGDRAAAETARERASYRTRRCDSSSESGRAFFID